jgi:hypothetical protein
MALAIEASGSQIVPMIQAAEPGRGNDLAFHDCILFCYSSSRSLLLQSKMRSVLVVVVDVVVHQALQMSLVENDHMIEQFSAAAPHESLRNTVLPGTLKAGSFGLDAEGPDILNNLFIEVLGAVEDQMARCGIVGKSFTHLLDHPGTCWVPGYIEVQNPAPIVRNDEEAVEHAEHECGYSEEIHGGEDFSVVAEKNHPSPCGLGISRGLPHPAENGPLGDLKTKHPQFPVNAWRTPGWVFRNHANNELAQFPANTSSSSPVSMPRDPRPIQLEPCSMPTNNGFRLDEDQCPLPSWPEPPQHHPEQSVRTCKLRPRVPTCQDGQLLPKRQIFQEQVGVGTDRSENQGRKKPQQA